MRYSMDIWFYKQLCLVRDTSTCGFNDGKHIVNFRSVNIELELSLH